MQSIQSWFDAYGESHQNKANKIIHWICVPLIFYSILGLIASIPSNFLIELAPDEMKPLAHWGTIALLFVWIFYLRLSPPIFVGVFTLNVFMLVLIAQIENTGYLALSSTFIFILAWVGQFIGHHIEGKKPSFLQDVQFLLIGPAWLLGFIYRKLGISY